jgi:hypothetical protein
MLLVVAYQKTLLASEKKKKLKSFTCKQDCYYYIIIHIYNTYC